MKRPTNLTRVMAAVAGSVAVAVTAGVFAANASAQTSASAACVVVTSPTLDPASRRLRCTSTPKPQAQSQSQQNRATANRKAARSLATSCFVVHPTPYPPSWRYVCRPARG